MTTTIGPKTGRYNTDSQVIDILPDDIGMKKIY